MLKATGFVGTNEKMSFYENNDEIRNPKSKTYSFLLKLYTLEFGNPPLYSAINKAMRTKDSSTFDSFGLIVYIL